MFAVIARLIDRWKHRDDRRPERVVADRDGVSVVGADGAVLLSFR